MKQAAALIHKTSRQKPMSTLRSFVKEANRDDYWSNPDPLAKPFELRRLKSKSRSKSDFYEYY